MKPTTEVMPLDGAKELRYYVAKKVVEPVATEAAALPRYQDVFYLFDRSGQWQRLIWPLPEQRSGMLPGEWLNIEVWRHEDVRALSGTEIWFG